MLRKQTISRFCLRFAALARRNCGGATGKARVCLCASAAPEGKARCREAHFRPRVQSRRAVPSLELSRFCEFIIARACGLRASRSICLNYLGFRGCAL
jgi:hypothetical protein